MANTYQLTDNYGRTIEGHYWIPGDASNPNGSWAALPTGTPASQTTSPAATTPLTNDWVDQSGTVHSAGTDSNTTVATSATSGTNTAGIGVEHGSLHPLTVDEFNAKNAAQGPAIPGAQKGQTYLEGNHANVTTNEQDAAAAAQRNPQQATTAPQAQAQPVMPWAPGHTGADVQALQNMLVSKGYMTAAEVATGPGIFGPKTQAALSKYQMDNGNGGSQTSTAPSTSPQNGSGGSQSTGTGQSTRQNQPATSTTPAKSAVQSVIDDFTTAYNSLGLGDIKTEYQKFVQDQTDLTNKQNEEKQNIDNNPWMSQGVKDNTKAQIDTKYETRQNTLTHQISLLDSLYQQGQMEVNNIVTKSESIDAAQAKDAADLAQKQIDAATELRKEAQQDSQFQQTLAVQQQNADTSRISATKTSSGSSTGTAAERAQEALAVYGQVIAPGKKLPDGTPVTDSNGYITPVAWKALINDYQGSRADFIKQYGNNIYTETTKDGTITVPSSYGLTPAEVKLIAT